MKNLVSAFQWVAFVMASSIVAPIAVADLFGLSGADAAEFVQRTIFVLGVAGLLQVTLGHKLPINEGPAGLWWGVFALYAGMSTTLFATATETLQALQGAMLMSGVLFILLSLAGLIDKISKLFTPVVTGIYILLLVMQLSKSFLNGMLGVGYNSSGVDLKIAALSLVTVLFTFYVTRHKVDAIRQYGVLIALMFGWALFALFGAAKPITSSHQSMISLPKMFVFGEPHFDFGMIMTSIFVTLLLLTNMIASVRVVENLMKSLGIIQTKVSLKKGGFVTGVNQLIGGVFSAIGPVPISGAAGFIATTRITSRLPFILGAVLIIGFSLFPSIMNIFSSLPVPVGYAVTFVVFASMIGMAFSDFDKEADSARVRSVIGVSLLCGVGVMFVPSEAFKGISPIVTSLLSNGLIFGTIVAIMTDQWLLFISKKRVLR